MNNIDDICNNHAEFCNKLEQFFIIQLDWIYTQIRSYPEEEYWHQVFGKKRNLLLNTFDLFRLSYFLLN
jgi:hypothetical protein